MLFFTKQPWSWQVLLLFNYTLLVFTHDILATYSGILENEELRRSTIELEGDILILDDLLDDVLYDTHDGKLREEGRKKIILRQVLEKVIKSGFKKRYFVDELEKYTEEQRETNEIDKHRWDNFLDFARSFLNIPKVITLTVNEGLALWKNKLLPLFKISPSEKKIFQLKSLDQKDLGSVIAKPDVACGYCAVYNADFFDKNLKNKSIQEMQDDGYLSHDFTLLGKEYFTSIALPSTAEAALTYWVNNKTNGARKILLAYYENYVRKRLETKPVGSLAYENEKENLFNTYLINLEDTRITPNQPDKFAAYINELAEKIIEDMLFQEDLRRLVNGCTQLGTLVSFVSLSEIFTNADFFKEDIEEFLTKTGIADFFSGMREVRKNNGIHFVMLETGNAHWITIIFKQQEMFIIDSLNQDRRNDEKIKLFYDIFYLMPEEKIAEALQEAEPSAIAYSNSSIDALKQKLEQLKKALENLKMRLEKLAEQLHNLKTALQAVSGA